MSTIDKHTYLRNAALKGRINNVRKYIDDDTVDINGKCSPLGYTALRWACWNRHPDIAELLLDHGTDIDAPTSHITPLSCMHVLMVMLPPPNSFWIVDET